MFVSIVLFLLKESMPNSTDVIFEVVKRNLLYSFPLASRSLLKVHLKINHFALEIIPLSLHNTSLWMTVGLKEKEPLG